jgi:hypothetical protein
MFHRQLSLFVDTLRIALKFPIKAPRDRLGAFELPTFSFTALCFHLEYRVAG